MSLLCSLIAEVLELPKGMAYGQTYQEALSNLEQINRAWIQTADELGCAAPKQKGRLA
jgi:predicted RNase H-like HicB family nuclease